MFNSLRRIGIGRRKRRIMRLLNRWYDWYRNYVLNFLCLIGFCESCGETFALSKMQFHYLVSVCVRVCVDGTVCSFCSSDKLYLDYTSNGNDTIAIGNQQFITILPMNTLTGALLPLLLLLKVIRNVWNTDEMPTVCVVSIFPIWNFIAHVLKSICAFAEIKVSFISSVTSKILINSW